MLSKKGAVRFIKSGPEDVDWICIRGKNFLSPGVQVLKLELRILGTHHEGEASEGLVGRLEWLVYLAGCKGVIGSQTGLPEGSRQPNSFSSFKTLGPVRPFVTMSPQTYTVENIQNFGVL